jgi:nicotinamidase-related amidase
MEQTGQGQRSESTTRIQKKRKTNLTTQALLIIDHQVGLAQVVRDYNTNDFRNNILGHAALGNVFNLPTVLTTSSDAGPNGLMLKEITDMHPNATFVRRQGEVNAWDNADFRAAVEATGKKQLIIAGIVTEVCKWSWSKSKGKQILIFQPGTSFLALSLVDAGYEVFANTDASGTFDARLAEDANRRMERAGVTLMGLFGIVCDLMRDWRKTPGLTEVLPFLDK